MNYEIQDFHKDVIQRSFQTPVVVDFWAEWCGPCRILGPTLERLAQQANGRWALAKVDTEQHAELAMQYGIQGIPAIKLFVDGKVINEFVGALPEPAILKWLQDALPNPLRNKIKKAQELLAAEQLDKAELILRELVTADPNYDDALILLATVRLFEDWREAWELVRRIPVTSQYFNTANAIQTLASLLEAAENPHQLPEGKGKETYLAALNHLRERQVDEALSLFIDVVRKDRAYHDDGARKACIAMFAFLGSQHELALKYRSELSSALYA
ncbi:thioredoxin [Candidatus Moduliflexus flocculans]|uniref:Thioredoxin n=1 Tax=Candidatus Moduliflexus flocculans TaxID=1499966 RepID=A0A081BTH1_9BACT|nr:thioredoxin [Candidatus Moduliflexus flocculans]